METSMRQSIYSIVSDPRSALSLILSEEGEYIRILAAQPPQRYSANVVSGDHLKLSLQALHILKPDFVFQTTHIIPW